MSYSASDFLNILHQRDMNTLMKAIEEHDISGCDSRTLVVSSVSTTGTVVLGEADLLCVLSGGAAS
jgi:hypothetical protein